MTAQPGQESTEPKPRTTLELKVLVTGLNPEKDDPIIICDEVSMALGDLAATTGWKFEVPYP